MTDPRKPVFTPDHEDGARVMADVHRHLLAATENGAMDLGCTGVSFVILGMAVWMAELSELDGRAASKYLRALADISDPRTNDNQKRRAEKDRSQAVRAIYAAVDLTMTEAQGNG